MLTYTDSWTKFQRIAQDTTPGTLEQGKQDINTGYHLFNAKLARYYTRAQQFTDIKQGQDIYQTPIDCLRITGLTSLVGGDNFTSYSWPLKEISSEYQWRQIVSYRTQNNWPTWYISLGNDKIQVWPIPSQDVTNGFRLYYQPVDQDLSIDDILSTNADLVTVTNGSPTVVSTGTPFSKQMIGLSFQNTGVTDLTFYDIIDVPNDSTLTLKSAYIGFSNSDLSWRIGQTSIIPPEYGDAPIYYALGNYFSAKGNEQRASTYRNLFEQFQSDADEEYSSSQTGSVITSEDMVSSPWFYPPLPGPV